MAHEDLTREDHVEGSSDRSFGLVFAGVFSVIALWPLVHGHQIRLWAMAVAAAFGAIALIRPALLSGLNRLWLKLGIVLGKVVSPIMLAVLFFLVFAPMGVLMRMLGKDPLRLKLDPKAETYWVKREPPGPPPNSMNNQF